MWAQLRRFVSPVLLAASSYFKSASQAKKFLQYLAEQEAKTIAGAAGASVACCIALGPVGLIGGAFIKGKQVTIPAGTLSVVQTSADKEIQGAIYQGQ